VVVVLDFVVVVVVVDWVVVVVVVGTTVVVGATVVVTTAHVSDLCSAHQAQAPAHSALNSSGSNRMN
jgi:hypothetical protein